MFCLSRRANVVESFSDGNFFLQNFHAVSVLDVAPVLGHGKPANLWLRASFHIAGNARQARRAALADAGKR
jgi:hypothetical protein